MQNKILVRGAALAQAGYGHECRTILRALRKFPQRFDIYLLNTPWGSTGWIWEDNDERKWIDSLILKTIQYQQQNGENARFDISVQVTIPAEWQNLARINIGHTAGIETTKLSPQWLEASTKVNKILVTSTFSKYAFENTTSPATNNLTGQTFDFKLDTPIEVATYPARLFESEEFDLELPNDFNFLVVAQWCPRKNIENTIKCFVEEFLDKKVGLILKLNSASNSLADREATFGRLKNFLAQYDEKRKCSVHLLHGDLSDKQMTFLYKHPKVKALFSLSHNEGFGLPQFEAVCNGLPLVAPASGGINDFIFMPQKIKNKEKDICMIANVAYDIGNVQPEAFYQDMIIEGSQWAFPKEWHAKAQLRDVWRNYPAYKNKALKLQKYILKKFEENSIYFQIANSICEDFPVIDIAQILDNSNSGNPLLEEVQVFD